MWFSTMRERSTPLDPQTAENQKWSILPQTSLIPWGHSRSSVQPWAKWRCHTSSQVLVNEDCNSSYVLVSAVECHGPKQVSFELKKINRWGNLLLTITGINAQCKDDSSTHLHPSSLLHLCSEGNALLDCGRRQALVPWRRLRSMWHFLSKTKKLL